MIFVWLANSPYAWATKDDFTGSQGCESCHAEQTKAWRESDHAEAMQHANKNTVLGDFDNTEYNADGITSRFFTRDGKYWINTDGADGELRDFEIRYTFGIRPLQQYLVEFPDGRVQALRIAWDTRSESAGGQRWFHLYPDEVIVAGDLLHWTGSQQNWNYMCADCHSTNLVKAYDSETNTFNTSWSEINVGCESCHGPGRQHLTWTALDDSLKQADPGMGLSHLLRDRKNISWTIDPDSGNAVRSQPANENHEIDVCAACHSRRGQLREGIESSGSFLDYYRPALLSQDLYHADGQILDEVYVWGSFAQSKMKAAGVSCSDCHDPHSGKLRAQQEQVCSQCHLVSKYATSQHHGHEPDSTGANCLECHMPETTYMVVDPRRDHSLRIPRPDLSLKFGTPNACNQCHLGKNTEWAALAFSKLWPDASDPYQDWAKTFSLSRSGAPQSEIALIKLIRDKTKPDIARATAVSELRPYLSPLSGQVVQIALSDKSPLVRFASLGILDSLPPENRYQFASPLLNDPVLLVRSEAARVSAPALRTDMAAEERALLQLRLQEYIDTQLQNAERPESHLNLGNLYTQSGNIVEAEKAYRLATRLDKQFGPAYANLADLYRIQGMDQAAGKVLLDGIDASPGDAMLYHALGLLQVRSRQMDAALLSLKKAVEIEPETARYSYVYGVALNSTGKSGEALEVLEQSVKAHPRDQESIFMIASIYRDQGNAEQALMWAQKLLEINPADQNATRFVEALDAQVQ